MSHAALAVWLREECSAAPRSRISAPNTQTAATGWPLFVSTGEATACKVGFELSYAFNSGALEAVVSPVFDRIANTFVDSFVQRAESLHGAR